MYHNKKIIHGVLVLLASLVIFYGNSLVKNNSYTHKIHSSGQSKKYQGIEGGKFQATVVYVVDGDTIDIQGERGEEGRVRLLGIDTPETVDPRKPVQCFGKEASTETKSLLLGQKVMIKTDSTQDLYDKYDRLLAYVFLSDGTNINKLLITEGYAHEYTYHVPYQYQADFKKAEQEARVLNRGLWNPEVCR